MSVCSSLLPNHRWLRWYILGWASQISTLLTESTALLTGLFTRTQFLRRCNPKRFISNFCPKLNRLMLFSNKNPLHTFQIKLPRPSGSHTRQNVSQLDQIAFTQRNTRETRSPMTERNNPPQYIKCTCVYCTHYTQHRLSGDDFQYSRGTNDPCVEEHEKAKAIAYTLKD